MEFDIQYQDFLDREFFWDFSGLSVLEIAPFAGHQTQILARHALESLTLVEPNPQAVATLRDHYPWARIIDQGIFSAYQQHDLRAQAVVCLGLLYHLHSPLMLLEHIVDLSQPRIIVLDSVHCQHLGQGGLIPESMDTPGNRYRERDHDCAVSVAYPAEAIDQALGLLGYQRRCHHDLDTITDIPSKRNSWMARWERA